MRTTLALILTACLALPATAQEWTFGLGSVGVLDDGDETEIALEALWQQKTEGNVLGFSYGLGAAAEVDGTGGVWVGGGGRILRDFGAVRMELSLMPGLYEEGDDVYDLGGVVNFRSRIGLSVGLSETSRIGLSVSHLSNAGIYDRNPGRNAAYLTYGWSY
ncbi:acyloxyacyl hydrolase [Roseobacter sp. HKCCA0434]|uniref:acyloxyacyl hydrolase n=1 Tax=Roseobacter sp. HKCCA0434 TaxID=3079297 RepID=UPI002905D86A|nr:acyloxyacyl hydrolase [Roseobacter sp. HKCCA0434]